MPTPKIPDAAGSIQKGIPMKHLLGEQSVYQLGENISYVYSKFQIEEFAHEALKDIEPLSLTQRASQIAHSLKDFLPGNYTKATEILLASLTPPLVKTEGNGLASMFYMPHASFIAEYGLNSEYNAGKDPFDISMKANYELTKRFTSEYCIRPFIIQQPERTFKVLYKWMLDENLHVRRLCSEGTRPKLPWSMHIRDLVKDPSPSLPILEELKNDNELYVRRSVANHLGDIAKDHLDLVLEICTKWLPGASNELKWVIRHALRHPAKKEVKTALNLRKSASEKI